MKTTLKLKLTLGLLFTLNLQSAFIYPQSSSLFAQNPELFEHEWYLHYLMIDETATYSPMPEINIILYFNDNTKELDYLEVAIPLCEDGHGGMINFDEDTVFNLETFDWVLLGVCTGGQFAEFAEFLNNHYSVYAINDGSGIPKNPFAYTVTTVSDYYQLTIENNDGDWAVYNSVLLSTPSFDESSFNIYPNPVKETLHINNNSKQQVTATIYDVSGKELQKHSFENNNETVDVKAFNPGLYFIVFENEMGERVSKKFIKKQAP